MLFTIQSIIFILLLDTTGDELQIKPSFALSGDPEWYALRFCNLLTILLLKKCIFLATLSLTLELQNTSL